jgi:DNA-binding GntR family transcriptional regulator
MVSVMTRWRRGGWHTGLVTPDSSPSTKRQQVAADMASRIRGGEWAPGTKIPSIEESLDHYRSKISDGVGKNTIVDAYKDLVAVGLVYSEPKSGHRVTGVDGGSLAARVAKLEGRADAQDAHLAEIRRHLGLD